MRGSGLLIAAVVAFVLVPIVRRQEVAYLACFLLAVPVFSLLWVAFRPFALSVRRRFTPESGTVGETVEATIFVQNQGSFRTPATVWVDRASAPLSSSEPATLPPLPGTGSALIDDAPIERIRYRIDTSRRGAHEIGPFELSVTDPFGCATRKREFGGTDTLLVTPMVFELARIDLRLATGDGAEQVSRRLVGAGEQDVIARKYLPGDSMRRVHWPATAKHGELMVRQDDQRNDQDAVLLLDAASFQEGPAFEWAVSAIASAALHLMNEGFGVRLVGHARPGSGLPGDEVFTAPFGASRVVRDLALATTAGVHDPADFRLAVDEAALTSPDAPPVFAVVSATAGGADRIRPLAGMSSHPIAFVVGEPSGTAAELRQAGWTTVECSWTDHLPSLWKAIGDARGIG